MKNIQTSPASLKSISSNGRHDITSSLTPFRLGYFNIEHHQLGYPDELVFLPICSTCDQPITDLRDGNVVADVENSDEFRPAGTINGNRPLKHWLGEVYAFHKNCDVVDGYWNELEYVMRADQRLDFERDDKDHDDGQD